MNIENLIKDLVNEVDYDIAKQLDPELNEYGPENAQMFMNNMKRIISNHLTNLFEYAFKMYDPNDENFYTDPDNYNAYCGWGNEDDARDHGYDAGLNEAYGYLVEKLKEFGITNGKEK